MSIHTREIIIIRIRIFSQCSGSRTNYMVVKGGSHGVDSIIDKLMIL